MTELEELIQFWQDYLKCPETLYPDLLREKIRSTIMALARLQSIAQEIK